VALADAGVLNSGTAKMHQDIDTALLALAVVIAVRFLNLRLDPYVLVVVLLLLIAAWILLRRR
jgi:hypothetical protein